MARVKCFKTIDLEFDADVDIDDVIAEMQTRVEDMNGEKWCPARWVLDPCTRILAGLTDEWIAGLPESARAEVHRRLTEQAKRYAPKQETH